MPANTPWPSCSIVDVFPCIATPARTTDPPNTAPIAWWPRHTPRIGAPPPPSPAPTPWGARPPAQNRRRLPQVPDHAHRHARLLRPARTGRDDDAVRLRRDDVFDGKHIAGHHPTRGAA